MNQPRRVLVTGHTGLVGHGIARHLRNRGYEVWGASRKPEEGGEEDAPAVRVDLACRRSVEELQALLPSMDAVVHAAAALPGHGSIRSLRDYFTINVLGTSRLLEMWSARESPGPFVYVSTTAVVRSRSSYIDEQQPYLPSNGYALSKTMAEILCRRARRDPFEPTILRIRAPYGYRGRREGVVARFVDAALSGSDLVVWGGGTRRQTFTFVEDVGRCAELALLHRAGGVFHVAGPQSVSTRELAEEILRALPSCRSRIVTSPKRDPQEGRDIFVSTEKAFRVLGYQPAHSLPEGLRKVFAWRLEQDAQGATG